jgi:Uma2 family endonuclease
MLIIKPRFESFEEYLEYNNDSENFYELFNGELIEMPPESGLNIQIANRLFLVFALMLGSDRIRGQGLELEVRGEPKNRYPDLTILRKEHIQQLSKRNTIRLNMTPPLFVIEIVSPGEIQRDRDYIAKRMQYQDCGIPEYWIVDPQIQTILVLELVANNYTTVGNFSKDDLVRSPQFTQLNLKVSEILNSSQ